jgi:hypothetical protein
MAEKKQSSRTTTEYEFSLTHADILDLMRDAAVGLSPDDDETFSLFMRKENGSEINLSLRPMYEGDTIVFRYYGVVLTEDEDEFTDVDVS